MKKVCIRNLSSLHSVPSLPAQARYACQYALPESNVLPGHAQTTPTARDQDDVTGGEDQEVTDDAGQYARGRPSWTGKTKVPPPSAGAPLRSHVSRP